LITERYSGLVTRLVSGGHGLIHHEQGTVLINDALPGEEVVFSIRERSKGVCWADIQEISKAHPQRIEPPCPLAGTCGGCAWQHIPLDLQRDLKAKIFEDSFSHQLHQALPLPLKIHPSPGEAYRIRARMKPDKAGRLGFVRRRSHEIIPINHCLLFCPPINQFLQQWNADPPRLGTLLQADLLYSPSEKRLGLHLDHIPSPEELKFLNRQFPEVLIGYSGQEAILTIRLSTGSTPYQASPAAFFQVNHFLWPFMLDAVKRHLPKHFSALDLYSGVGFLIPPLMVGQHMPMAAENHPLSVRLAKQTFPQLTILRSDTNHLQIPAHVNLIVCDPPRSGLSEKTRALITESSVQTLLYISCNQATLLRDIKNLLQSGWQLNAMEAFDLFPHTPHLELFAKLTRPLPE